MTRSFCRSVIRLTALIVPRLERRDWRGEWLAEVDYSWKRPPNFSRRVTLTSRTGTAVPHAFWFRKEHTYMGLAAFFHDLRIAARTFRRQRGFTAVAIATLALGIGANAAIFSVINRTLLTPLPFGHPEQLVQVWETIPEQQIFENTPAPATLDLWKERSTVAAALAAYTSTTLNITSDGAPERLRGLRASASLLPTLQLAPIIGRGFTSDEDRFGGPSAVMLTHAFWSRRFHSDPSVVGRAITLDGQATEIVGVLPEDVPMSMRGADVWVPLAMKPIESRQSRMLWVVGRLRPGATASQLQHELDEAMHRAGQDHVPDGIGVSVKPLDDQLRGGVRPDLLLIFGVSAVVLLIACANIATMLLARSLSRQREMAIRASLGAGRARLARMLLAESAMLGIAGGAVGLAVGAWSVRLLQSLMPATLAGTVAGGLDARVLAFTFVVALAAAFAAGLAPLAGIGKSRLMVSSRSGSGEVQSAAWLRAALVSGEIALAVVLLAGAAILTRTFVAISFTPTGFSPAGVLTAQVPRADRDDAKRTAFYEQLVAAASHLPGVTAAGLINGVPIRWTGGGSGFQIDDRTPATFVSGHHRIVSAGYFAAMGIPLVAGESFSGVERKDGESVAVVSESFAKKAWPDSPAVGHRIRWGADGTWIRIVGVAGDVRLSRSTPPEPHVYLPFTEVQYPFFAPSDLVIRTNLKPGSLAGAVRDAVRQLDPNQPVAAVMTMDEVMSRSMGDRRFTLSLIAVFAGVALTLCAIGIYGVLSYTVRLRTREFGVRIAIGATSRRVRLDVLRQGLAMTAVGVLAGSAAVWLMSRWLATVVPGMASLNAPPVAAAAALLVAVSAIACDIPARRAMRVSPMAALRDD